MELSAADLNRTLLARQHLLARSPLSDVEMVGHLIGLQAQETLSPYAGLAARLDSFDLPTTSDRLATRELVRMVTMRGTIHLLTPDDALMLRGFTQPVSDRERRASVNTRPALHLDQAQFRARVREALADGPLAMKSLGEALTADYPDVAPNSLAHLARIECPLVQLPPRGQWGAGGGVVYDLVTHWLGREQTDVDVPQLIRRYLRAFGPASAADVTAWCGVTRLGAIVASMTDLVTHTGPDGKALFDVPEGEITPGATRSPVRLLGIYDNLWLSHAGRDRVTTPDARAQWAAANGGTSPTVFVDGHLTGLWRLTEGHPTVTRLFRTLTRAEQTGLDEEIERFAGLLG